MTQGGEIDQAASGAKERCNPVGQDEVSQVIRSELRFKAVRSVAEQCRPMAPALATITSNGCALPRRLSAQARTLLRSARSSSTNSRLAAGGCGILSHVFGCSLCLDQIACGTYYLRAVDGQGARVSTPTAGGHARSRIRLLLDPRRTKHHPVVEVAPKEAAVCIFALVYLSL